MVISYLKTLMWHAVIIWLFRQKHSHNFFRFCCVKIEIQKDILPRLVKLAWNLLTFLTSIELQLFNIL